MAFRKHFSMLSFRAAMDSLIGADFLRLRPKSPWRTLLPVSQGYPCLILIRPSGVISFHRWVSFNQQLKERDMNDWNESQWFEEWLKLARNKWNQQGSVA